MRSPSEIRFRLRQETINLRLWLAPPSLPGSPTWPEPLPLPRPDSIRKALDDSYVAALVDRAARIAGGELPAFDTWIQPAGEIRWRKDYRHGQETGAVYFRRIPYLNFSRTGDSKWIWEINRHQHLVTLAQAWALDPRPEYSNTLAAQLESWLRQNPPQCGINWASALEVAFRALSWIWIWHLAGPGLPRDLAGRFLNMLYVHGLHLEANLSLYFSPNTHLLGEALALDAIGRLFPAMPGAARWVQIGSREMALALRRQVREDGSHFEQSSYYHVYALDMFLFHRVLAGPGTAQEMAILKRMAEYLAALLGSHGRMPLIGDDDGGRLFSPFGRRDEFGRATLAVYHALTGPGGRLDWLNRSAGSEMAAWWLGRAPLPMAGQERPQSKLFGSAGTAVLLGNGAEVIVDAGPFGLGSAGHSHADTLQVLVRRGGRELVIDPGTFTYNADSVRELFRGTAAHATVEVVNRSQAEPQGAFRWASPPAVRVLGWESGPESDWLAAECGYGGLRHRRVILFDKAQPRLWVADWLDWDDPEQELELAQIWPLGEAPAAVQESTIFCAGARLALECDGNLKLQEAWRSSVYGQHATSKAAVVRWTSRSPARRAAMVDWIPQAGPVTLRAVWEPGQVMLTASGGGDAVAAYGILRCGTREEQESR